MFRLKVFGRFSKYGHIAWLADKAKILFWITWLCPPLLNIKPPTECVIDEIAFHQIPTIGGIQINAPTERRLGIGPHIVENVIANDASRRYAETVDQTSVAQYFMTKIMDMVQFDDVVVRAVRHVIPVPTNAKTGIEQIMNVIMRNSIRAALGDPNTYACRENVATVEDVIVIHQDAAGFGYIRLRHVDFPYAKTSRA